MLTDNTMPLEEKINYLNTCTYKNKLSFLLASTCAPVIKNLTCANTLTLKSGSYLQIIKLLKDTKLNVALLYKDTDKEVLMIYREEILGKHINESYDYLKEFKYECDDINYVISKLNKRFKEFYKDNKEFPHELGIFLNYPIEDIKGFIKNKGQNSLITKYWKVYSNLNKAKDTFKKFDEAFEQSIKQIVDGYKISEIIA